MCVCVCVAQGHVDTTEPIRVTLATAGKAVTSPVLHARDSHFVCLGCSSDLIQQNTLQLYFIVNFCISNSSVCQGGQHDSSSVG